MAGLKDLSGRHVLLTGAGGGIGAHIARTLAGRGARLTIVDLNRESLEAVRASCQSAGAQVCVVDADVTRPDERARLLRTAEEALGPVDVLLNVAGIAAQAPFTDVSAHQVSSIITVNLDAPIQLTKLVLPAMLERRSGVVVQMGSLAGKLGMPYNQIYGATKAGLIAFTRALRQELHGTGAHASVVCPSFVRDAGMWAELGENVPAAIGEVSPDKVARAMLKAIGGAPEVLVTAGPTRPLVAVGELSPRLGEALMRRIGFVRVLRTAAQRHNQGEDRAPL